ncbi:MAG: hypothetical protein RIC16_03095 [Rhodospirillales bacterium]
MNEDLQGFVALSAADGNDLADHFLECGKVGRYLTLADESRFVITDDFRNAHGLMKITAAAASVFSRDALVAQAALLPLGLEASRIDDRRRERFEALFDLIERSAFSEEVRSNANSILRTSFREARIRALEAELGGTISPARQRYRSFLDIIRALIDRKMSISGFREEFLSFTRAVAGRLDFGIYSFCLDRIFANDRIPLNAKGALVAEILLFPPMIRRELITNLLSQSARDRELSNFVRSVIEQELDNETVVEIYLLVTLKTSRLSVGDFEDMLRADPDAALTTLGAEASPAGLA